MGALGEEGTLRYVIKDTTTTKTRVRAAKGYVFTLNSFDGCSCSRVKRPMEDDVEMTIIDSCHNLSQAHAGVSWQP